MLPDSFALKYNHGCGFNYICADKSSADTEDCFAKLRKWERTEYWRQYAELQYRNIEKKIICEKYLSAGDKLPVDYKVYCFNGRPLYIMTCEDRGNGNTHFYFFDSQWRFCPITHDGLTKSRDFTLPKPKHLVKCWTTLRDCRSRFPSCG